MVEPLEHETSGNGEEEKKDEERNLILIEFDSGNSSSFKMEIRNVSPVQIFGVLPILDMEAKSMIVASQPKKPQLEVARNMGLVRDHKGH